MMATDDHQGITARNVPGSHPPGLPARVALSLLLAFAPVAGRAAESLPVQPAPFSDARSTSGSGVGGEFGRPIAAIATADRLSDASKTAYVGRTALSATIIGWMAHEARRSPQGDLLIAPGPFDPPDTATEERRSVGAERIITRALHRTFNDHLESFARGPLGLEPAWRWLENFGDGFRGSGAPAEESSAGASPGADQDRMSGSIGLRIDAHPRLLLRGSFLGLRARLDVPIRNEPIRLSLTRRVGSLGQAGLSAGRSPDGDDWAWLGLRLSF